MADFYVYLIASLPMLHYGAKPPFSFEHFLQVCQGLVPGKDLQILCTLPKAQEYAAEFPQRTVIRRWVQFDTELRNELARTRASRKHVDPDKYIRLGGYGGSGLAQVALAAQRNPSVTDAENILDEARWKALEELATGHYFDLDFLIIYAYKLCILERWDKARSADKTALLEQALQN